LNKQDAVQPCTARTLGRAGNVRARRESKKWRGAVARRHRITGAGRMFRNRRSHRRSTMQIKVTGHKIDVTPALRDSATEQLERLSRYFDQVQELNVVLGLEKLLHKVEATVVMSGKTLHAVATASDMYAAIDVLVDKLESQVRKHKEKVTAHHANTVRSARYE
jgi:putative sigma-54 modulation protein